MRKLKSLLPNATLIILAMIFLFPLLVMFTTSFKTNAEAFDPSFGIFPKSFYLGNYLEVFQTIPFFRYLFNTITITALNMLGTVLVTPMVAFSLSKLKWKGKKVIFTIIVSTMLIPYTVTMVPLYKLWVKLGLVGTYIPLILPAFFGYPYYIIILRQFMLSLPDEMFEAATIDGCNNFRKFVNIALPLSKSGIITITIFSFLFTFSDFLGPMLYINKQSMFTLSLGLQAFMNEYTVKWTALMAASSLFVLPVLVLFLAAQKYFIEGIATTGIK